MIPHLALRGPVPLHLTMPSASIASGFARRWPLAARWWRLCAIASTTATDRRAQDAQVVVRDQRLYARRASQLHCGGVLDRPIERSMPRFVLVMLVGCTLGLAATVGCTAMDGDVAQVRAPSTDADGDAGGPVFAPFARDGQTRVEPRQRPPVASLVSPSTGGSPDPRPHEDEVATPPAGDDASAALARASWTNLAGHGRYVVTCTLTVTGGPQLRGSEVLFAALDARCTEVRYLETATARLVLEAKSPPALDSSDRLFYWLSSCAQSAGMRLRLLGLSGNVIAVELTSYRQ